MKLLILMILINLTFSLNSKAYNNYYNSQGFKLLEYKNLRILWRPVIFSNGKMDVLISEICRSTATSHQVFGNKDYPAEYIFSTYAVTYKILYDNTKDYFKRRNNGTLKCIYDNNIDDCVKIIWKAKDFYDVFHKASKYILFYFKIQNEINYTWYFKYKVYINYLIFEEE